MKEGAPPSTREFSPLQFPAGISQHVPDMRGETTRFFGMYSARTRGAATAFKNENQTPPQAAPACHHENLSRPASSSWAGCMKRISNVDPLLCTRCGETMTIKSFILPLETATHRIKETQAFITSTHLKSKHTSIVYLPKSVQVIRPAALFPDAVCRPAPP